MKTAALLAVLLCLACPTFAADRSATRPAPPPTTRPSVAELERAVETAEADFQRERAAAMVRLRSRPEVAAATADLRAKERHLEQVRASGTPQQRLEASAAYNKVRIAVEKTEAEGLSADPSVRQAADAVTAAKAAAADREAENRHLAETERREADDRNKAAEAERMKDPVYRGLRKGYIVVGMTKSQVDRIIDRRGELIQSEAGVEVWRYEPLPVEADWVGDGQVSVQTIPRSWIELVCTFRGEKLVSVRKYKH